MGQDRVSVEVEFFEDIDGEEIGYRYDPYPEAGDDKTHSAHIQILIVV